MHTGTPGINEILSKIRNDYELFYTQRCLQYSTIFDLLWYFSLSAVNNAGTSPTVNFNIQMKFITCFKVATLPPTTRLHHRALYAISRESIINMCSTGLNTATASFCLHSADPLVLLLVSTVSLVLVSLF